MDDEPFISTRDVEPPRDRVIYIRANVVQRDTDGHTAVTPYEGRAHCSATSGEWLDAAGLSIRMYHDADLVIIDWREWQLADADADPGYSGDDDGGYDYGLDECTSTNLPVEPIDLKHPTPKSFPTRLDALRAELAAMPEHKQGSEWHLSRQAEIDLTVRQLAHRETFRPSDADVMPRAA